MPPPSTESPQSDTRLQCPRCGYNLTAVTSSTCPECGEQFIVTNSQGYLARFPPSKVRQVCNALWLIGTVLIVLSWVNAVTPVVGWIGFGVAGVGWVISLGLKR